MAFRNRSAQTSRFAMVPRADVPRSVFRAEQAHKTTFDAGWLIPIYVDEVLPGDHMSLRMTAFCRMATPIVPVMDNLYLDTFFFFVPCRLVWEHWKRFMGEREEAPDASTSYLIPTITSAEGGFAPLSIYDYFGVPTSDVIAPVGFTTINALPLRAYNLIFEEWFKDQNMVGAGTVKKDDGPDVPGIYFLRRRGKRHDYFTSCLPWPMKETSLTSLDGIIWKGGVPVSGIGSQNQTVTHANQAVFATGGRNFQYPQAKIIDPTTGAGQVYVKMDGSGFPDIRVAINDMRLAFAAQRLMERDARGGTRYTEIVRSHFGVISPDARLQRPEYLGGGSAAITVNPIVQTSASDVTGSSTPLGELGGVATGVASGHGFSQAFTEHGYIIGLASVRADLTYQQGLHKMWSRSTKYDFYWPAFAHLGEQAVKRNEIFSTGTAGDEVIFGYQERWAEYRYKPNRISGLFRSTTANSLDIWHLAQRFGAAPVLGQTFIDDNPPVERVLAVGSEAAGQQFLFDSLFSVKMTRPMPTYSVPGLADHF